MSETLAVIFLQTLEHLETWSYYWVMNLVRENDYHDTVAYANVNEALLRGIRCSEAFSLSTQNK